MTDEYRDPDSHMHPNGTSDEICNRCRAILWRGDDGWACNCDSAMYEYAKPEEQEPSVTSEMTETADDTKTDPGAAPATDPPTPVQRLAAVLPDHAAISAQFFSWAAMWSTPNGVWAINKPPSLLKTEPFTLAGPRGIKLVTLDVDLIITVLRHQNAIETP